MLISKLVTGLFFLFAYTGYSQAATYNVTQPVCTGANSYESAILAANANPGPDIIEIQAGLNIAIDGCTQPRYAEPFPIPITDSVEIIGNGASFYSGLSWISKQGTVNPLERCPDSTFILGNRGLGFMQIGDYSSPTPGIKVKITNLKFSTMPVFAVLRDQAELEMDRVVLDKFYSTWPGDSCNRPIIQAEIGTKLTIKNSQLKNLSVPTAGFRSPTDPWLSSIIFSASGSEVNFDSVTMENGVGLYVSAMSTYGVAKIVNSRFNNSQGFDFNQFAAIVNSSYFTDREWLSENISAKGIGLVSKASTFYFGYPCDHCAPGVSLGIASQSSNSYINFESTAIGSPKTGMTPVLWGPPASYQSDAYTWVQPTDQQPAAVLSALLPNARVQMTGLPAPDILYYGTELDAITPYVGPTAQLIDVVPDSQAGGINQLVNPIDGSPIVLDVLGNPRWDSNNYRNIGAVQLQLAPHLMVSGFTKDAVTLNWSRPNDPPGGSIIGYLVQYKVSSNPSWSPGPVINDPTTISVSMPGLTPGQRYDFRVAAMTPSLGPWSNIASETPRGAPDAPIINLSVSSQSIQANWTVPPDNGSALVSYLVLYRPVGTTTFTSRLTPVGTVATTFAGLTNGTQYEVHVIALNSSGSSQPGIAYATPVAPPTLQYSSPLSWTSGTPLTMTPSIGQVTGNPVFSSVGTDLPAGLSLGVDGKIIGTPTTVGTWAPTIRLASQNGHVDAVVNITIVSGSPSPKFWYPPIQTAVGAGLVSSTPTISGIPSNAEWSVNPGSTLPPGFTINPVNGVISGTATVVPNGVVPITIKACWDGCDPDQGQVRLEPMLFWIVPNMSYPANTPATAGVPVTVNPSVNTLWSGGEFSLAPGSQLPDGLDLDKKSGVISGTPQTAAAVTPFTVRYSTNVNVPGLEYVESISQINVSSPQITLIYPNVTGNRLQPLSVSPTTTHLTGPAVYTLVQGTSLPAGLTLDPSTGLINGTPSSPAGSYSAVVQVTDAYGSQRAGVSITINNAPPPPNTIPTLSERGQIMMMFMMIATVGFYGWRQKRHG